MQMRLRRLAGRGAVDDKVARFHHPTLSSIGSRPLHTITVLAFHLEAIASPADATEPFVAS
jgi:hypothetical protein